MIFLAYITYILLGNVSIVEGSSRSRIYHDRDPLPIWVRPLSFGGNSFDKQLYLYTVDYYNATLGNCMPKYQTTTHEMDTFSLFNFGFSDGPFNTTFGDQRDRCTLMCDRNYKEINVTLINDLIRKNYKLNFYIDDVPVGRELYDSQTGRFYIDMGVPLGYLDIEKVPHYFNHFQFIVTYRSIGLEYEVLYATVSTQSLTRIPQVPMGCDLTPPLLLRYSDYAWNGNRISYDVIYQEVEVDVDIDKWSLYRHDIVRPFISNSILTIFTLLALLIAAYANYTLKYAFTTEKMTAIYKKRSDSPQTGNQNRSTVFSTADSPAQGLEIEIDELYDFSWPGLTNDVFRRPTMSPVLYVLVSLGFQAFIVLSLAVLLVSTGFNVYTGNLIGYTVGHFYFAAAAQSVLNGYLTVLFDKLNTSSDDSFYTFIASGLLNSFTLPIVLRIIVDTANDAYASVNSPSHISLTPFNAIMTTYILISSLAFGIVIFLLKPDTALYPAVNNISKKVSEVPITFKLVPNFIITGIFPFGVIVIPLSTIYLSLWYNHFFSGNNFQLLLQLVIFVVLLVAVNALNLYYLLSIGDWRWQWKSFINGASLGFFTFAYTIYLTKMNFGDHSSMVIGLLQNFTISLMLGLMGGFLSFAASFLLVSKLYTHMV